MYQEMAESGLYSTSNDLQVTIPMLHKEQEVKKDQLPPSLEYLSYLIHLAVFGILGVLTRYLLQKLFGPGMANVTSNQSILYLDLPSNMVGSFLMGWFGVVFKGDISDVSDQLAIGLSTGYLGSLTTFSGWNQKMLELSLNGQWVASLLGFVIGLFLAAYSITLGVDTAKGFRWLITRCGGGLSIREWWFKVHYRLMFLLMLVLMWACLWGASVFLAQREFENGGSEAQLGVACLVAPLGVWIRWWLSTRLNGTSFHWIPFGTLIANVSASCIMATLAALKNVVNTKNCDTVATGIQFGLLGSLSTVSTMMAEMNAMAKSSEPWKGYAYSFITIAISFSLSAPFIYFVPLWTNN